MLLNGHSVSTERTLESFLSAFSKSSRMSILFHLYFLLKHLPCSMKILREFYFADWQFFVVCGNTKFLRFEMTEISGGN